MTDTRRAMVGSGLTDRRWVWIALATSCVLYVTGALFHLFVQKPYTNGDEKRHVQYVVVLETKGRLPTMRETRGASHPPAYYALQAATALDGIDSTKDAAPRIGKAALISIGFGLIAVVYAGLTLVLLLPRHPGIAVFAGALVALLPTLPNNAAAVNNDAMALAAQLGMLYAALTVLLRGPSALGLLHAGFWMCLGALTRVSVLAVVPVALLAIGLGGLFHGDGTPRRRVIASLLRGLLLVAALAAAAGWFYLRNEKNLGDVSGTDAVLEDTRNHPVRPFLSVLFDPGVWLEMQDELWGRFAGGVYVKGALRGLARVLVVASVVGAAVAVVRARLWRGLARWRSPTVVAWLLMALTWAAVFLPTLYYHSRGGGLHQRYLFGALPIITLVLALGVSWTSNRTVVMGAFSLFYVLAFGENLAYAAARSKKGAELPLAAAMQNNRLTEGQADAFAFVMLVVLAIGLVLLLQALAHLHRPLAVVAPGVLAPATPGLDRGATDTPGDDPGSIAPGAVAS